MKGYTTTIRENFASARLEGVDASYKDLAQVCGRIRNKDAVWAMDFLKKASEAKIPVMYKSHNKRLGHRKELGGKKGRYPKKAAKIVMKVLQSALANGMVQGFGESYRIFTATANKKYIYPRMAAKGRRARANYELARVEVVLMPKDEVPKGVEVTLPKKEPVKPDVSAAERHAKKEETPAEEAKAKEEDTRQQKHPRAGEHKHELEKEQNLAHAPHERHAFEHGKGKKIIVKSVR